jgi:uncharacterized protein YeaO (DUF488 family)
VPRSQFAARDFYDVWLPDLSPSPKLVTMALAATDARTWKAFVRGFRHEMKEPAASRLLDLLAAMSRESAFSMGCYCADEAHCHRSVLRALLEERGAVIV